MKLFLGKLNRHWPVKSVQEMFLRNVEMEICVCWGREGVTTASLLTEKVSESFWREELRGVEYSVLHQVSQTCTTNNKFSLQSGTEGRYDWLLTQKVWRVEEVPHLNLQRAGAGAGLAVLHQQDLHTKK